MIINSEKKISRFSRSALRPAQGVFLSDIGGKIAGILQCCALGTTLHTHENCQSSLHYSFSWQISCVCIFNQAFMADFMCMNIKSSLYDIFFWQISCVCIFSQVFMADFLCMHIQSSLYGRFFWQILCIYHIQSSLHDRFHAFAYPVKPLWQISCVCIFIQSSLYGRFHVFA